MRETSCKKDFATLFIDASLDLAANQGEWRLQFVRRCGEEFLLNPVALLEPLEYPVEAVYQRDDLRGHRLGLQPRMNRARRDGRSGPGEITQWLERVAQRDVSA